MGTERTNKMIFRTWVLPIAALAVVIVALFALTSLHLADAQHRREDERVDELFTYISDTIDGRNEEIEAQEDRHNDTVQGVLAMIAHNLGGMGAGEELDTQTPNIMALEVFGDEETMCTCVIDSDGCVVLDACDMSGELENVDFWKERSVPDAARQSLLKGTRAEGASGTIAGVPIEVSQENGSDGKVYSEVIRDAEGGDSGYLLVRWEYADMYGAQYALASLDFIDNLDADIDFLYIELDCGTVTGNGADMADIDIDEALLRDGYDGTLEHDGEVYRCRTRVLEPAGVSYAVVALWREAGMASASAWGCALLFFTVIAATVCIGVFFARETRPETAGGAGARRRRMNRAMARRLLPCVLIGTAVIALGTLYVTDMSAITDAMRDMADSRAGTLGSIDLTVYIDELKGKYNKDDATQLADAVADYITFDASGVYLGTNVPYYASEDGHNVPLTDADGNRISCVKDCVGFDELLDALGLEGFTIYNIDGMAILTTEEEIPDTFGEDSPYYPVLMQRTSSATVRLADGTSATAVPIMLFSAQLYPGERVIISAEESVNASEIALSDPQSETALLVVRTRAEDVRSTDRSTSIAALLQSSDLYYSYMLFDDDEAHTLVYASALSGVADAQSIELPERMFGGMEYSIERIGGQKYLLYSRSHTSDYDSGSTYWLVTMIPMSEILSGGARRALTVGACGMLCLALVLVLFSCRANCAPRERGGRSRHTAGQKTATLLRAIVLGYLLLVIALMLASRNGAGQISVMNWIMRFEWEREIGIFSLTTAVLLVAVCVAFNFVLGRVIASLSGAVGERVYACCRLLGSVLRYASMLFCVFYSLYLFGLDTVSVLQSLGVFSMIVGLGANKLIGDIVAGMFLVFEGDVRVGDIVTVGTFCGKVTEIGIRTTKIENLDGNVNIVTNSKINDILNMTRKGSRVKIMLKISNAAPVEQVEAQIRACLPDIVERCAIPCRDVAYVGIDGLADGCCVYRIEATCAETKANALFRYLNRELAVMCNRNGFVLK